MAILTKIRSKNGLLIGFTAVALFLFLFSGLGKTDFFSQDPRVVGKLNGEKIFTEEYRKVENALTQQMGGISSAETKGYAWSSLIERMIMKQKFAEAGLTISDEMIWSSAAAIPQIAGDPRFADGSGNFNPQALQKYVSTLPPGPENDAFQNVKSMIEGQIVQGVYIQMYQEGSLLNKKEIQAVINRLGGSVDMDYVMVDYNKYAQENNISVSDDDIKAYMKKYSGLFKIDENRTLDYVYVPVDGNEEDKQGALTLANKYISGNQEEGIEAFSSVADDEAYVSRYGGRVVSLPQAQLGELKSFAEGAGVGSVSSPMEVDGNYMVAKMKGVSTMDSVKFKTILVSYTGSPVPPIKARTQEQAKVTADSLVAVVRGGTSFEEVAKTMSDDKGQGVEMAVLSDETQLGGASPEEKEVIMKGQKGSYTVVKTDLGYKIYAISDRKPGDKQYQIAFINTPIMPSDKTLEEARTKATNFMQKTDGKSNEEFQQTATADKLSYFKQANTLKYGTVLRGLSDELNGQVLAWAFDGDRKTKDSEMFVSSTGGYVIAKVAGVFSKGLQDPSTVSSAIKDQVKREKVLAHIKDQAQGGDLNAIAQKYKSTVQKGVFEVDKAMIGDSYEGQLLSIAGGIKEGQVSKVIKGNSGAYFVKVNKKDKATTAIQEGEIRAQFKNQKQALGQLFMKSLIDNADIKDYRGDILNASN